MTLTLHSIVNVKTLESKIVYQNKWMTVKEDVIERENGMGIYGIVEKADFAVIAAIESACDLAKAELREETGIVAALYGAYWTPVPRIWIF